MFNRQKSKGQPFSFIIKTALQPVSAIFVSKNTLIFGDVVVVTES